MKRMKPMTRYQRMDDLLRRFGTGEFNHKTFWRMMALQNFTDSDIDAYCDGTLASAELSHNGNERVRK